MDIVIEKEKEKRVKCRECGGKYVQGVYYISKENNPWCVARIEKHRHAGSADVYFSVIFGSWSGDGPFSDHVTFSCRFGYIEGRDYPACTLVQEPKDDSIFGRRLSRDEAMEHELLDDFWVVVDRLIEEDKSILDFVENSKKHRA